MKKILIAIIILINSINVNAQYASEYDSGYVVKLNEDGKKYIRFILSGQAWFQDFEGKNPNDGFSVKRARLIAYSQINDNFLILTHFGANGISDNNLSTMGKGNDVQIFLHEMILQFKVNEYLTLGGGLHNYGGISRGNGQGSINMLTLDNNRADWSTLGLSDQYSNHLGMFAKGRISKFNYRFSISDATVSTLDGDSNTLVNIGEEKYLGKALLGKSKYAYSGYVDYQFYDQESNLLPYRVGTYLGSKKIFNIGAGFFNQNDAIVENINEVLISKDVNHFAIDAFYDAPIGKSSSITTYLKYQKSDMGNNYLQGNVVGNGNQFSGHVGYLIPKKIEEGKSKYKNRFQPYTAYSYRNFSGLNKPAHDLKIGTNWYIDGLNAKITVEYQKLFNTPANANEIFTLQAMILL